MVHGGKELVLFSAHNRNNQRETLSPVIEFSRTSITQCKQETEIFTDPGLSGQLTLHRALQQYSEEATL